jgi:hypothetical protein
MEGGEWESERAQPPLLSPLVNVGIPLPIILKQVDGDLVKKVELDRVCHFGQVTRRKVSEWRATERV